MKLTIVLLVGFMMTVSANSYSQKTKISVDLTNTTIKGLFGYIEQNSEFIFLYRSEDLNTSKKVSIEAKDASINEILDQALKGEKVVYDVYERQIVIRKAGELASNAQAPQKKEITGSVKDQKGLALPGVTVMVKGTTSGTVTDEKGQFVLPVAADAKTLQFSFVGMKTMEEAISDKTTVYIVMQDEIVGMNEVVVVGYGTMKKASLTGAVSSIGSAELKNQIGTNVLGMMAGQISGVQVVSSTGRPGANPVVRIRGTGSLGASNIPLYVVDGMPLMDQSELNQINSNDIESINVLKEASSAAIYGSRGSNGVIIITTKKGKAGQDQFNFSYSTGFQDVPKRIKMNNRDQEVTWWKENSAQLWKNVGGDPAVPNGSRIYNGSYSMMNYLSSFDNPSSLPNTDWQSVVLDNSAPINNYQLSASGGTDRVHYFISGGILDQDGIVKTTGFKRYNGRVNLDAKVNDYVKVGMNLSPSYSIENLRNTDAHINSGDADASFILGALVQSAAQRPKDPVTGVYGGDAGNYNLEMTKVGYAGAANPLQVIEDPLYKKTQETMRLNSVAFVDIEPIKGLVYHSDFGVDEKSVWGNWYRPSTVSTVANGTIVNTGTAPTKANLLNIGSNHTELRDINYVWNNTLNFQKVFNDIHSINVLAGYAFQKDIFENNTISGTLGTYSNDAVQYVSASTTLVGSGANKTQWDLLSYFGRANYSYKDKYIVDGSIRRDGSSRFGANQRFANFPAASVAWIASQEEFMKPIDVINNLKLRAGYGKVGNFNIGNYPSIPGLAGANYNFGGALAAGYAPGSLGNPNLTWETTTTTNVGIDLSLLKSRINLTAEYYNRKTEGMLYGLGVPAITGFTSVTSNIGNIQNRGIELQLSTVNISKGSFQWTTNLVFFKNKNKVLKLGINNADVSAGSTEGNFSTQNYKVGMPMAYFYGYKAGGVFKDQADVDAHPEMRLKNAAGVLQGGPGDYKIVDFNKDGIITSADRTFLGDPSPDFNYNISNHLTYKNFDLDIQLQGVHGNKVEFLTARFIAGLQTSWAQLAEVTTGRWKSPTEPGNGIYGKGGGPGTTQIGVAETQSDRWLRDASYMRIRNLTLGYTLPKTMVQKAHIKSLRIYASAENLWTFTSYLGYNPDVSYNGGDGGVGLGVDYATYPVARTFTFGINLGF